MTNGLTKLAQAVFTPGVAGRPAVPPVALRWYLTPSPPGYYYVFTDGEWRLRALPSSTPPGQAPRTYSIPITSGDGYGYSFPSGATLTYCFATGYGKAPTYFASVNTGPAGGSAPPPAPSGFVLVRIDVYVPGNSGTTPIPSNELAPLPAGAAAIVLFGSTPLSNGYPSAAPARVLGHTVLQNTDGSVRVLARFYTRLENGGYVWDGTGDPDPPYFVTAPTGMRAASLVNFPGAPAVEAVPAKVEYKKGYGWDAGANSIAELDGNLYTEFPGPVAAGAYVGFFEGGSRQSADYNALVAAFRFTTTPTGPKWTIKDGERSVSISDVSYTTSDKFRIERSNGIMIFLLNGVEVYRSKRASIGPLRVGTTLYASGDKVL